MVNDTKFNIYLIQVYRRFDQKSTYGNYYIIVFFLSFFFVISCVISLEITQLFFYILSAVKLYDFNALRKKNKILNYDVFR